MLLADLPVTFWGFWMTAGFLLFTGLLWTIARFAVDEDAKVRAEGEADEAGEPL